MDTDILRPLIDLRDRTIQKNRIAFQHRVTAIEQGRDHADPVTYDMLIRYRDRFEALEAELDDDITGIAKTMPIIDKMVHVKGLGFMLSAKLVAMIDIERCITVSSLWRFAGFGVVPYCPECEAYLEVQLEKCPECKGDTINKAERLRKGEKAHYNTRLKTYCWQVGSSFLKSSSPYRNVYDKAREKYESRDGWSDLRKHRAAMRIMIKLFLQHFWLYWRTLEGLPTSEPFIIGKNGHSTYISADEFGWPKLKKPRTKKKANSPK